MKINKTPQEFGYIVRNNLCLFFKGCLSNWYGAFKDQDEGGFKFNNKKYNCLEQWMMSEKARLFKDRLSYDKIMAEKNPRMQQSLGRAVCGYDQSIWDKNKRQIVLNGIRIKFEQNPECREFLKSFNKNTLFVECNPIDSVWGIGRAIDDPKSLDIYEWRGENLLGEILREVRRELD